MLCHAYVLLHGHGRHDEQITEPLAQAWIWFPGSSPPSISGPSRHESQDGE